MPSDMKGILRPSICRFRLGGFEITTILDGVSQRDGPHPMFGADQPAEAIRCYLESLRKDGEPIPLSQQYHSEPIRESVSVVLAPS